MITGANGSGKTSALEAIYTLGFGRSFRTHQHKQVVKDGAADFTLFAKLFIEQDAQEKGNKGQNRIGYQRSRNGLPLLRLNGESEQRFSTIAKLVPLQLITPEGVSLITEGPKGRRQYMDWGLFHVEQSYFKEFNGLARLLRQRNSLLKTKTYREHGGEVWDAQIAQLGEEVTSARRKYLESLNDTLNHYCRLFLPEFEFEFRLIQGWPEEQSLASALHSKLEQDLRYGHTTVGPHKAEWQIRADGVDAKERLSRGQLKLLVAALRLVQGYHYHAVRKEHCVYLVDDLPAELDLENQQRLCQALLDTTSQVFITAIDEKKLIGQFDESTSKLFHVEHGTIKSD